jgi:hypothetical protein
MTTVTELRTLTGAEVGEATDVAMQMFIDQATTVVNELISDKGLSPAILTQITLYLSGHYYVMSIEGGGITYRKTGQSEERYKTFGFDGIGFMTSRFGQMACTLDTSGTLLGMSNKDKRPLQFHSYSAKRAAEKRSGSGTT